jgi:hypothetical protein
MVLNSIRAQDMFGYQFGNRLREQTSSNYNTALGGLVSILIKAVVIIYAGYLASIMVLRKDVRIQSSVTQMDQQHDEATITPIKYSESNVMLYFLLSDISTLKHFDYNAEFTNKVIMTGVQKSWNLHAETPLQTSTDFMVKSCSKEQFSKNEDTLRIWEELQLKKSFPVCIEKPELLTFVNSRDSGIGRSFEV